MIEIKQQAQHVHTLPGGERTSVEMVDASDTSMHWHEIGGERTSTDAFGEGHTHEFQGEQTSGPVSVDVDDVSDSMDGEQKESSRPIEYKYFGGRALEVKQEVINGVPVGIIRGYIATWDLDRGLDRFERGAFLNSLSDHRTRNGRQIRLKDSHHRVIGGFPIEKAFEDDTGLFAEGHINLKVQRGQEAFALAQQGVLSDLSIGFSKVDFDTKIEDGNRIESITEAIVWEGSIVDEPMNISAVFELKAVVDFQDLPIADRNLVWDKAAAIERVRQFTDSDLAPSVEYKKAFVQYDSKQPAQYDSYQLAIADVVGGKLVAVPDAIISAAAAMQGAKGGVRSEEHTSELQSR